MNNDSRKVIDLDDVIVEDTGYSIMDGRPIIILSGETGTIYRNQTNGTGCHHPIVEGTLLKTSPASSSSLNHMRSFDRLWTNDYEGACKRYRSDFSLLHKEMLRWLNDGRVRFDWIRADQTIPVIAILQLDIIEESWAECLLVFETPAGYRNIFSGVLTWPNSD